MKTPLIICDAVIFFLFLFSFICLFIKTKQNKIFFIGSGVRGVGVERERGMVVGGGGGGVLETHFS